ncbi:MAG: hypothetical protein ISR44_04895 [Rhodospirillales bacterium]|nr:hypothetical protein [Rhodospirillales bacterium]
MPDGLAFAQVEVVVCESNEPLRRNIQQLLRQLGFGDVVVKEKQDDCLPLLERGPVDLLICDDNGGGSCFGMVHGIRHQAIDNNPFVVSISLLDQVSDGRRSLVQAVNSGSDALIVKPFSTSTFTDRILAIANRRKRFVATADYIGPTRRDTPRNTREAQMEFKVPNPVKEIANGTSRKAMTERIRKGAFLLDRHKLRVNVAEIELRAGEVRDAIVQGIADEAINPPLAKLRAATSDIQRRMVKNKLDHVPELCHWMLEVADRIESENSRRDPRILTAIPQIINGFKTALNSKGN